MKINIYSREPILTIRSGSSSYVLQIIATLRKLGHVVSLYVTAGTMENRRVVMKMQHAPDAVDHLATPGYARFGNYLVRVNCIRSWVFAGLRVLEKLADQNGFSRLHRWLNAFYGLVPDFKWKNGVWNLEPCAPGEQRYIRKTLSEADVVVANYFYMAPIFQLGECHGRTKVILMHDLISRRQSEIRAASLPPESRVISESEELIHLAAADVVLAIQQIEADYVRSRCERPVVFVLPHHVPLQKPTRPQVRGRCLFVGTSVVVNVSGLRNFLINIWPLVLDREPDATLHVCGGVCSVVDDLPASNVTFMGVVPSLAEEYSAAQVCILPLLVGSGLKIKLVEALSFGRACVSTPVGVQGVERITRDCVLVSESNEAFGEHIMTLLGDAPARMKMEAAAAAAVAEHFSERVFASTLDAALNVGSMKEMLQ